MSENPLFDKLSPPGVDLFKQMNAVAASKGEADDARLFKEWGDWAAGESQDTREKAIADIEKMQDFFAKIPEDERSQYHDTLMNVFGKMKDVVAAGSFSIYSAKRANQ